MRIAAIEKMGYYPTPPNTLSLIADLLRPASRGGFLRFLDPCCGQGEALHQVAAAVRAAGAKVEAIGVELSNSRHLAVCQILCKEREN